ARESLSAFLLVAFRSPRRVGRTEKSAPLWAGRFAGNLRHFFHVRRVGAIVRRAVALGTMQEGLLRRLDVFLLAAPGLQGSGLQGAAVGEGQFPGMRPHLVHQREMQDRKSVV